MGLTTKSIIVEEEDWKKAQKLGINLSKSFRIHIKNLIYGEENKEFEMTPNMLIEIDRLIFDMKGGNPRAYLVSRCKGIDMLHGIKLGADQLEKLYFKRLKQYEKAKIEITKFGSLKKNDKYIFDKSMLKEHGNDVKKFVGVNLLEWTD